MMCFINSRHILVENIPLSDLVVDDRGLYHSRSCCDDGWCSTGNMGGAEDLRVYSFDKMANWTSHNLPDVS